MRASSEPRPSIPRGKPNMPSEAICYANVTATTAIAAYASMRTPIRTIGHLSCQGPIGRIAITDTNEERSTNRLVRGAVLLAALLIALLNPPLAGAQERSSWYVSGAGRLEGLQ